MANEQNLTPVRSESEAREKGRKGGINSGKARREKADLKKMMQLWFETDVAKDKDGNALTGAEYMVQIAAKEMKNGSAKFWELMRDTAGFKPVEKLMTAEVDQATIDEIERIVTGEEDDGTQNED